MNLSGKVLRAVALATALGVSGARAQQTEVKPAMHSGDAHSAMMADQKKMGAMHEEMMADMKAMDARLDAKVATMNAAKGMAKTNATADVVNEMVLQQKQMMAKMADMHNKMMENMAHPDGAMKGMENMAK